MDHLPDLVCCVHLDGTLIYANHSFYQYFQRSPDQLIGVNFLTFFPDDDRQWVVQNLATIQQAKEAVTHTYQVLAPDGSVRWQEWTNIPLCDDQGRVMYVQAIGRDVRDRKPMEQPLFQQEEHYRQAVEQSPNPILCLDQQGTITTWNQACQTLLLYDQSIIGQPFANIVSASIQASLPTTLAAVMGGESISGVELTYHCKDGRTRHMISRLYPLRNRADQVYGCVVANTDISDRKTSEQALQASEERLRSIFQQNRVGMNRVDVSGHFLEVNPAFCSLIGYSEAELLTMRFQDITYPSDLNEDLNLYNQLIAGHIPAYSVEKRYVHKSGAVLWANVSVSCIRDQHGKLKFLAAVIENIQERKQVEAALKKSQQRYQMAVAAGQVGIWEWNIKTGKFIADTHLKVMLGYDPTDLGDDINEWLALIHPYDRPLIQAKIKKYLAGDRSTLDFEHRVVHRDGSFRWFLARGSVLETCQQPSCCLTGTSTDITARKQVELQIQTQMQRERVLNHVIRAIRNSLDLDTIFETAAKEISALLPVRHVHIWEYQPQEHRWFNRVDYGADHNTFSSYELTVPMDNPIATQLLEQLLHNQLISIADPSQIPNDLYQQLAIAFPGAWLMLLLDVETDERCNHQQDNQRQIWGVLVLIKDDAASEVDELVWQPDEIQIAQVVTDQLAIAIQQSELYAKVQQLNANLEQTVQQRTNRLNKSLEFEALLKQITDKVRDSLDESKILKTAVTSLASSLRTISCDAAIYDLEHRTSTVICESTTADLSSLYGKVISMDIYPELYQQLISGQYLHYCNYYQICDLRGDEAHNLSIYAHPLIDDQGVFGDLWLYRSSDRPFSDLEIRLVQQVANQCAIAIRQSRLYQASRTQVIELEKLNDMKDDFLSTVSHELRSPMANINMATQMLEIVLAQYHIDNDTRVTQYLTILREQCNQELALINDLLDLQHLDAGIQILDLCPIQLSNWIPHIVESFEIRTQAVEQDLEIDVPDDLPTVMSDMSSLMRIVVELLNNACKYTPSGHRITVRVRATAHQWSLQVENSGIEIPPNEQKRVFNKFYRIVESDRWKHGGTGLGLALVKGLTEHLNGSIQLISQDNLTCFYLIFPTNGIDEN